MAAKPVVISRKAAPANATIGEAERQMRVDLAACYRLMALFGMDDMPISTHISARVPDAQDISCSTPTVCCSSR